MQKRLLGKLLTISLAVTLVLNTTACGKSDGSNGSSGELDSTVKEKETEAADDIALGSDEEGSSANDSDGIGNGENDIDSQKSESREDGEAADSLDSEEGAAAEDDTDDDDLFGGQKVPSSEEELFAFLEGNWNFINPVTGRDYALMEVSKDGAFSFGYNETDERIEGTLKPNHFYKGEEGVPLSLSIDVTGLDKAHFMESTFEVPKDGKDSTDVKLYYGSGDGEDFLYIEETGNGDSFLMSVAFQDPNTVDGSFSMSSAGIFMQRPGAGKLSENKINDDFYGWIWKADDKGLFVEEMEPLTWDEENEYTANHFTAAAFKPEKMESSYYEVKDSVNKRLLLNGQRLNLDYPRMMCRFTTDSTGKIIDIEETDQAFYGIYDLGDLDADVSYDGMSFSYNGTKYDLFKLGGAATSIMDVYPVYGKEIVECHVSPHTSEYYVFDRFRGEFSPEIIVGSNLIWLGDDFTTAIYAQWNEVRDLCGDLMFTVDGDEIESLEFVEDGKKVKCSYFVDGTEEVKKETFEMPDRLDGAMNAYCNYENSGRASDYRKFMEFTPEDAAFFVIEDPQKWYASTLYPSEEVDPFGFDTVMVVALYGNTTLEITDDKGTIQASEVIDRGDSKAYKLTVSESMPLYTVSVVIPDGEKEIKAQWPVTEFSGMTYQHCKYISESDSPDSDQNFEH